MGASMRSSRRERGEFLDELIAATPVDASSGPNEEQWRAVRAKLPPEVWETAEPDEVRVRLLFCGPGGAARWWTPEEEHEADAGEPKSLASVGAGASLQVTRYYGSSREALCSALRMRRSLTFRQQLALVTALGCAIRVALLNRPLAVLDRLYVPDDAYYALAIARSLARGEGPSASAEILTNGFQPLFVFLATPLFALFEPSPDAGLRLGLALSGAFGALNVALVGLVARQLAHRHAQEAGLLAALFWAVSPVAVAGAFTGLETSLALSAALVLVLVWRPLLAGERRSWIGAGLACGFALLARVDLVFLVALLGVMGLARGRGRSVGAAALVAAGVVAPWWLWSTLHFGSPVPGSGAAVRLIVADHQALYLEPSFQVGWAAGTVLGGPFAELDVVRDALARSSWGGAVAFALVLAALLGAAGWLARRERSAGAALFAHGVTLLFFYAFVVPAVWFFPRYLHSVAALIAMGAGVLLAAAGHATLRRGAAAALAVLAAIALAPDFVARPSGSRDTGIDGAKGYRDVALRLLPLLPEGARLASMQTGALGYYAGDEVTVFNLDGVVDARARRATMQGRLVDHARERGVTHFADWPFNVAALERASRASREPPSLRQLAEVPQGVHRFRLYELE